MSAPSAERYVQLGLRLGRHVDGIVDCYFGPPELAAGVQSAPPAEPSTLVAAADALLDELADGWLRDQVLGLRSCAGGLAGEPRSYADEVEGCHGVRAVHTDEAVFAAAHERLGQLLPGGGPLAERYERWQRSTLVPADRIERTISAVIQEARAQTDRLIGLPAGERVELEIVRGEPWLAFNEYLGDLRGRVSVNVDLPMSAMELLRCSMHETYPGHQAERSRKEALLVRGRGMIEEAVAFVPTPQSVVTEGIAELAPSVLLEGDGAGAFAAILRDTGIQLDLPHALAVERALEPCRWAEVNAALLLHGAGAGEDEVRAYLERWGLLSPDLAAHVVRFLRRPTSRTYLIAYPAGRDLCGSYWAGDPGRLRHLLTEQVRVRDLLAAHAGRTPTRA